MNTVDDEKKFRSFRIRWLYQLLNVGIFILILVFIVVKPGVLNLVARGVPVGIFVIGLLVFFGALSVFMVTLRIKVTGSHFSGWVVGCKLWENENTSVIRIHTETLNHLPVTAIEFWKDGSRRKILVPLLHKDDELIRMISPIISP